MNDASILKQYSVNGVEFSTGYTALETKVMDEVDKKLNQFAPLIGGESTILPDEEDLTTDVQGKDNHIIISDTSVFSDLTTNDILYIEFQDIPSYSGLLTLVYARSEKKEGLTDELKSGVNISPDMSAYEVNLTEDIILKLNQYGLEIGGDDITVKSVKKNDIVIYNIVTPISTEHIVMKLKDKNYDDSSYTGLGRKILRKNIIDNKNILLQSEINDGFTIYIVQYDFDLNGEVIEIPYGSVLDMRGGSFNNGTIMLRLNEIWPTYDHLTRGGNLIIDGVPAKGTTKLSTAGVNPVKTMDNPSTGVELKTAKDKTIIRLLIQNADEVQPETEIQFKQIKVNLDGVIDEDARSVTPVLLDAPNDLSDTTPVIDKTTGKIDMSKFELVDPSCGEKWDYDGAIGTLVVEEAFENGIYVSIPEEEHDIAKYLEMEFEPKSNVHVLVDYTDGSKTSHTMTHYDTDDKILLHQHKIMHGITIQGTRTKREIIDLEDLYKIYNLYEDEEIIDEETGFIITVDASRNIWRRDPSSAEELGINPSIIDPSSLVKTTYEHQYVHIKNIHVIYPEESVLDEYGVADLEKLSRVDKENEHLIYDPETKIMTYVCKSNDSGVYLDIPADEEARGHGVEITLASDAKLKVSAHYLGYHGGHQQIFDGDDWRGVPQYVHTEGGYYELKF